MSVSIDQIFSHLTFFTTIRQRILLLLIWETAKYSYPCMLNIADFVEEQLSVNGFVC